MLNYLEDLKRLLKQIQKDPKLVYHYLLGNYRYYCINSIILHYLVRTHIKEQYQFRLNKMRKICYINGSCVECGCQTPKLQMADKSCEGKCYPAMMSKKEWINYNK